MNNVKISLTVTLPGSVMVSKEESLKQLTKQGESIEVYDFKTNDKSTISLMSKGKKETIEIFTRKSKPARQVINMPQEAYDQFVSDYVPKSFKGQWKKLTTSQKVKWHCQAIAASLGGTLESYKVFD